MTKVYFRDGRYAGHEGGKGLVDYDHDTLSLGSDDFMLIGDLNFRSSIEVSNASLDAKDATITNSYLDLFRSKAENINNADSIWLWDNSSISNSSANELETSRGNNTVEGTVSAKVLKFYKDATLSINGVLKVGDKDALDFSKISGAGKIYGQKQHAYYDTNNKVLEYDKNIDFSTLNTGDGNETFSFDGAKLVLNEGGEFSLSGDKPAFITNNAVILNAHISGAKLINISGSGIIKELHLSNNARFSINGDFENAVIEKGSVLSLFKQVDFKNLSGDGFVNINGAIYDTDGNILNINFDEIGAIGGIDEIGGELYALDKVFVINNILKYNANFIKAFAKVQNDAYTAQQINDVDLLNVEMANNDNLF